MKIFFPSMKWLSPQKVKVFFWMYILGFFSFFFLCFFFSVKWRCFWLVLREGISFHTKMEEENLTVSLSVQWRCFPQGNASFFCFVFVVSNDDIFRSTCFCQDKVESEAVLKKSYIFLSIKQNCFSQVSLGIKCSCFSDGLFCRPWEGSQAWTWSQLQWEWGRWQKATYASQDCQEGQTCCLLLLLEIKLCV